MATSAAPQISVAVVGSTGLVGSHLVQQLIQNPSVARVVSLARRAPASPIPDPDKKLTWHIEEDSTQWPSKLGTLLSSPHDDSQSHPPPPVTVFVSALGSTRTAAGSADSQRRIDYDFNLDLARAARNVTPTISTYVLVSTNMADPTARFAYLRMKGELERDILPLGFPRVAFIRPGVFVGERDQTRWAEVAGHWLEKSLRTVFGPATTECWSQPAWWVARVTGRVAVEDQLWTAAAADGVLDDHAGNKVWRVSQAEVVRLAKEAGEKH